MNHDERRLLELFRLVTAYDKKLTLLILEDTVKAGHVEQKARPTPTLRLVKSERTV